MNAGKVTCVRPSLPPVEDRASTAYHPQSWHGPEGSRAKCNMYVDIVTAVLAVVTKSTRAEAEAARGGGGRGERGVEMGRGKKTTGG